MPATAFAGSGGREGLRSTPWWSRSRISYRMEIGGPQADVLGPQIGPQISADFPHTLASLVGRAQSREAA